jgi:HEAT repeat protein
VHDAGNVADDLARRCLAALAGHARDHEAARAARSDPDPAVRATALGALARSGGLTTNDVEEGLRDPDPGVRRRACEVAASGPVDAAAAVVERLGDSDRTVVEVAAWSLGELGERGPLPPDAVPELSRVATGHEDALAREAAVAALGALGDPAGLDAILAGTRDKPAVRRRAVLALASFDGARVTEALGRAATDRDWQVRDAAELLLRDDR